MGGGSRFWTILSSSQGLVDEAEVSIFLVVSLQGRPHSRAQALKIEAKRTPEFQVSTTLLCERRADSSPLRRVTDGKREKLKHAVEKFSYVVPLQLIPSVGMKQGPLGRRVSPGESRPVYCAVSHKGSPTSRNSSPDMFLKCVCGLLSLKNVQVNSTVSSKELETSSYFIKHACRTEIQAD